MTTRSIRIPDALDRKLVEVAETEHISLNSAVVQAVESWVRLHQHRSRVQEITAQVMAEDQSLLRRLADS
jgi:predicted transcriptional regulator